MAVGEARPSGIGCGSGFTVRPYRAGDSRDARRIFAEGVMELGPAAFRRAARSPTNTCLVLAGGGAVYGLTASPACGGLACLALLGLVYLSCREVFAGYVRERLKTDMADIEGHYLGAPGAGFWVAEEGGRVVGTVAVTKEPGDPSACQLLRLSVDRRIRRRGLGMRLTREALDFAKAYGYRACLLQTSNVQEPALRMYLRMGFRIQSSCRPESRLAALYWLSKVFLYKLKHSL